MRRYANLQLARACEKTRGGGCVLMFVNAPNKEGQVPESAAWPVTEGMKSSKGELLICLVAGERYFQRSSW